MSGKVTSTKPKAPSYKERYEEQLAINKVLEQQVEVNNNDLIHITKQRDDATKAAQKYYEHSNDANHIVRTVVKTNRAIQNALKAVTELSEVALSSVVITAATGGIISKEDLEEL